MARSPRTERTRHVSPLALALLFSFCAADVAAEPHSPSELAFARRSQPVASHDLDWLEGAVQRTEVRVHEPYEGVEVTFAALRFDRVLDAVYGSSWRGEEELLFSCRDGYQPTVPVARVLAHRAWLAFDRIDQPGFTIRKRESGASRQVELGPFYLVWENLEDEQVRQEADYGWPYQLVSIDLIRRHDRFPRMTPPSDAAPEVLAGFDAFRIHCSKCHKLNGEGGDIGPELGGATSPIGMRDRDWLRQWIVDPTRSLATARMPALNPALPHRDRTADEIIAYLHAMATLSASEDR